MREVKEWVGKDANSPIPPRVKLRIWERCEGRCYLSGRKIHPGDAYDFDHIVALVNGGENRESNLAPALRDKHREKTKIDVGLKSVARRKKSKHIGIKKAKGRPMPGTKASGWKKTFNNGWVRRDDAR